MKKYIYLLTLLVTAASVKAQSIETVRMSFTQTLFPKKPLQGNIRNYSAVITTPYLKDDSTFRKIAEDKYQNDLKNYPNLCKEAEKNYDQVVLVEHEKNVKEAKEKYKLESDQYSKMSLVERLALIEQKPMLRIPEKPTYYRPQEPRLESINTNDMIIFNPETLAKSYIKLNGFGEATDGVQIKIDFKGFEYMEPVAAVVDVENYNPQTKEKFYTKQTQFVTKYRHPTTVQVTANNANLLSGVFQQTGAYQSKITGSKPSRIQIEKQEVETILKDINAYLNDQYGYTELNRNVVLYYVKNKKGEYDDIEKAKNFAQSGYKNYAVNQTEAVKDIHNAIAIWEKTITEVNYEDSKARIDEKVGTALLKNLIFATIITNEFDKADKYLADFKKLRLSYDDKQFVDSYEKIYSDMKSRFNG